MEFILNIAFWFTSIFSGFYFFKVICCFVNPINFKVIKIVLIILLSAVCNVVIYVGDIVNVTYAMVGFILIMLFLFKDTIIRKLSVVFMLYPIVVSLNYLVSSYNEFLYYNFLEFYNIFSAIRIIIHFIIWFFIYKLFKNKIINSRNYINNKTWILIDIICLAPFISIVGAIILTPMDGSDLAVFPTSLACIITSLGILYLIEHIVTGIKTKAENQNLRLQQNYYEELEQNQTEIRKIRHDLNNHLSVIATFFEENNKEKAKEYFHNLSDSFQVSNRVFCKNGIINAVINSKYNAALQGQIDCFVNIDIDELIPIENIHLCSIFANAFENAIEASLNIKDVDRRKITLKCRTEKGIFSFLITNNIEALPTKLKGKYITEKADKKNHGFGLENIKIIADNYSGNLNISHTESEFSLLLVIPLN